MKQGLSFNFLVLKPRAGHCALIRRALAVMVAAILLSSTFINRVSAAAGDLDPSFGIGGKAHTTFGTGSSRAYDVAVQADGKIVVVGEAGVGSGVGDSDFAIARYNADGSLDTTFGSSGKVSINLGSATAYALAIQANGKIVVGGFGDYFNGSSNIGSAALVRCNIDGSLDQTFGSGGKVFLTESGIPAFTPFAIAVQPDGRILITGSVNFLMTSFDFALIRLNANGSLDSSFGAGGAVYTDFDGERDIAVALAVQSDGRIVVVGWAERNSSDHDDFGIARYNPNGTLDTTFGTGGLVTTEFTHSNLCYGGSVKLLPGGKLLVGGSAANAFALAQYNADGSLDTSFGTGGKSEFIVSDAVPEFPRSNKMDVLANGKIVMTASLIFNTSDSFTSDFLVARFNSDGSPDTSFGSAGTASTDFFGLIDHPHTIASYGGDQILVAGEIGVTTSRDIFGLTRYLGDALTSTDLSSAMSAALSQDHFGNRFITYTIKVSDSGPDHAYYVTLKDRLPVETVFQSVTAPAGWVVYAKPAVGQWGSVSVSRIQFGQQSATLTLVVKVLPSVAHTSIDNSASFSSSFTADPNTANNTTSTHISIP